MGKYLLTAFLLMGSLFQLQARQQPGYLQRRVTLSFKDARLSDCFTRFEQLTGVHFYFNADDIKGVTRTFTADFNDQTIETALNILLKGTDLIFQENNIGIVLKKKAAVTGKKAETNPGTIKGRVVDFETSEPLPGATVRLQNINITTVSDEKGYYHFTHVKPGEYQLIASYSGYSTNTQSIKLENGSATYDIRMQAGSAQLGTVVVSTAGRKVRNVTHTTDKGLLETIKNAPTIVNGISSEQISKTADRNAAQAITKVSGVTIRDEKYLVIRGLNERYNLTYLNDNVAPSTEVYSRAFDLSLIPSRIIDKILVYKSASPSDQGDATGGVVKIYTKDAKNIKHLDFEVQWGYRPGRTFKKHFFTN